MKIQPSTARRVFLAVVLFCVADSPRVRAQSIMNASRIEFSPSSDHLTLAENGDPLVTGYTMTIYAAGSEDPLQTVDLGKPSPDEDGFIRLDLTTLLTTPLPSGVIYEAVVEAVGPGGSSGGPRTNTFGYTAPCATPTIDSSAQSFTASGGSGAVSVTGGASCAWTASSPQAWVTIAGGAESSGPGSVSFTVAANPSTTPRSAILAIAGNTFTVSQAGASCSYSVAPMSLTATGSGLTGAITVSSLAGCPWSAKSKVTWIAVDGAGDGDGIVTFNLLPNATGFTRSTTLTIAGKYVTVSQPTATKPSTVANVKIVK